MLSAQNKVSNGQSCDSDHDCGEISATGQSAQQLLLRSAFLGADEESTNDGADNANRSQDHGQSHCLDVVHCSNTQSHSRNHGANIGLVQVSAHTGNVTDVVAHIVGDNSGVTGVILGDASLDLTNQVSADVSSLGEDTAANTGKQSHGGSAHTEGHHSACDILGRQLKDKLQQTVPDSDIQQAQANNGKAHNATSGESNTQAAVQAVTASISGSGIGSGSDLHADKAGQTGEETAGQECKRNKGSQHLQKSHDAQNNEHNCEENTNDLILATQVGVSTLPNGGRDLDHLVSTLREREDLASHQQCKHQAKSCADDRQNQKQ